MFVQFLCEYLSKEVNLVVRLESIRRPQRCSGWSILLALHSENWHQHSWEMLWGPVRAVHQKCCVFFCFFFSFIHDKNDMAIFLTLCLEGMFWFHSCVIHGQSCVCRELLNLLGVSPAFPWHLNSAWIMWQWDFQSCDFNQHDNIRELAFKAHWHFDTFLDGFYDQRTPIYLCKGWEEARVPPLSKEQKGRSADECVNLTLTPSSRCFCLFLLRNVGKMLVPHNKGIGQL